MPDFLSGMSNLPALGLKYGPFLFAAVLIVLTRWSQSKYVAATMRQRPPAKPDEISVYKWTFVGTSLATVALISCSVVYWIWGQTRISAFEFTITDLGQQQHVWFDGKRDYSQSHRKKRGEYDLVETSFAVVRDKVLTPGDVFTVQYEETPPAPATSQGVNVAKPSDASNPIDLEITYNGTNDRVFTVKLDAGKPTLKEAK